MSSSRKSHMDHNNNIPPFIKSLVEMLKSKQSKGVIEFDFDRKAMVVRDSQKVIKLVEKFFRHLRFKSFVRNLNVFGFHKKTIDYVCWFFHPTFVLNEPDTYLLLKKSEKGQGTKKYNLRSQQTSTGSEIQQSSFIGEEQHVNDISNDSLQFLYPQQTKMINQQLHQKRDNNASQLYKQTPSMMTEGNENYVNSSFNLQQTLPNSDQQNTLQQQKLNQTNTQRITTNYLKQICANYLVPMEKSLTQQLQQLNESPLQTNRFNFNTFNENYEREMNNVKEIVEGIQLDLNDNEKNDIDMSEEDLQIQYIVNEVEDLRHKLTVLKGAYDTVNEDMRDVIRLAITAIKEETTPIEEGNKKIN